MLTLAPARSRGLWPFGLAMVLAAIPAPGGARAQEGEATPDLSTDEKELEDAFNSPGKAPSRSSKSGDLMEGVPPPRVIVAPRVEEPATPAERELAARVEDARRAQEGGDLEGAAAAARDIFKLLKGVPPTAQQQALQRVHGIAQARGDEGMARRAAERWLLSCGPDKVKACQNRALAAMEEAGLEGKVAKLRSGEDCLERAEAVAERGEGNLPGCLSGAIAAFRSAGDRLMAARGMLAQARVKAHDAPPRKVVALMEPVAKACAEPRCADVQRGAQKALAQAYLKLDDPAAAVRAAFREAQFRSQLLPLEERPYARSRDLDQACTALEAKSGPGACRKLEKATIGRYFFHDFSRQTEPGTGLPREKVKMVNDHYGVSLEECFTAEAARLPPHQTETYRIRWTILNDGRVDAPRLDRRDQDSGPLGQCLRDRLRIWRYPKYRGEWQNVEQDFKIESHLR
jgi:hypothetical protein